MGRKRSCFTYVLKHSNPLVSAHAGRCPCWLLVGIAISSKLGRGRNAVRGSGDQLTIIVLISAAPC